MNNIKTLAIEGHKTRGNEVIELLEMLGGKNIQRLNGALSKCYYIIDNQSISVCMSVEDDYVVYTLEEYFKKFPFKVGDRVTLNNKLCSIIYMCWECNNIYYQVQGTDIMFTKKVIANELKPYKGKNTNMNTCNDNNVDLTLKISTCYVLPDGFHFADENGNVIDAKKILLMKNSPSYPKTYAECCGVIGFGGIIGFTGLADEEEDLYAKFIILKRCRDAYWKIAGEEMGLGKPWEPDWNEETDKFTISNKCNKIYLNNTIWYSEILAFPTAEIRNTFYENFKDLIEQCKELL